MSDWGGQSATSEEAPPFISTYSRYSSLWECKNAGAIAFAGGTSTWSTANQARYYPISLPFPYLVQRVWWINGTAVGGNACFAIYTSDGGRLYTTGSTVTAGASTPQLVTPGSPLLLVPGDYYFGFNHSATANACWGAAVTFDKQRFAGVQQQAVGATALPDPATFAAATVNRINVCGVTNQASGF